MDEIQPIQPSPAARSAFGGATALFLLAALLGALGVVLLAFGQLPAIALLIGAVLLGFWGARRGKQGQAEIAPNLPE